MLEEPVVGSMFVKPVPASLVTTVVLLLLLLFLSLSAAVSHISDNNNDGPHNPEDLLAGSKSSTPPSDSPLNPCRTASWLLLLAGPTIPLPPNRLSIMTESSFLGRGILDVVVVGIGVGVANLPSTEGKDVSGTSSCCDCC